jgi:S-adenosylmethionine:tRNA ribosyltransferase-isomerase
MENEGVWKVLAKPGRHVKPGMRVKFASDFVCDVVVKEPDGTILVQFSYGEEEVRQKANKYGHVPVPPYVHPVKLSSLSFGQSDTAEGRFDRVKDDPSWVEQYQTVYAKHEGSVAAPTAGFHFTPELIQKLKNKGVEFAEVTLHVGLGTFLPVKSERVEDHTMHSEWVEVSQETADAVNRAKSQGRRVVAVGTTTVRTLEGVARFFPSPCRGGSGRGLRVTSGDSETPTQPPPTRGRGFLSQYTGDINLFIKPGFEFKVVDAMITNFHLPKSTLLMLVCAFAGDTRSMLQCYKEAVDRKYRFYSFGDAMFIL